MYFIKSLQFLGFIKTAVLLNDCILFGRRSLYLTRYIGHVPGPRSSHISPLTGMVGWLCYHFSSSDRWLRHHFSSRHRQLLRKKCIKCTKFRVVTITASIVKQKNDETNDAHSGVVTEMRKLLSKKSAKKRR